MPTAPRKTPVRQPTPSVPQPRPAPPVRRAAITTTSMVIELADQVWNVARFRRANPDYQLGKPFVYVGMTGHSGQRDAVRQPRLPGWADEGWTLRSCI
mgnify:CR=1 FL=1